MWWRKQLSRECRIAGQHEKAAGAVVIESEKEIVRGQDHGSRGFDSGREHGVPVRTGFVAELCALDCVSKLGWNRAAAVIGKPENRAVHEASNEGVRQRDKADGLAELVDREGRRSVVVAHVDDHRDDGCIDGSSSTLRGLVADHAVLPNVMSAAIEVDTLGFEVSGEIHQSIHTCGEAMGRGNVALAMNSTGLVGMDRVFGGEEILGKFILVLRRERREGENRQG